MSTFEKINELNVRRSDIEMGGCKDSAKSYPEGKLLARQAIKVLLDTNSFVELGAFVTHRSTDFNLPEKDTAADGVVTGFGTVDGRLVYVYSQDATVIGGSVGEMNAKKVGKIYEQALKMGAPVIAILDSTGVRLQEGLDALEGYGEIFKYQCLASGVIPQISVVLGNSLGINSFVPALSDFVFMEKVSSKMFLDSPNTINSIEGKTTTFEQAGCAKTHSERSGLADFIFESDKTCLEAVRNLIGYLPSNNLEDAPLYAMADDLNRIDEALNTIILSDEAVFDVKAVILSIADNGRFLEIKKEYAKNIVVGFARFNGYTAGIIANQSLEDNGQLDIKACEKASSFINFCDAYNIPVISLTDTMGYKVTLDEQVNGITKAVAKLMYSFTNASIPKINVIVRQAFGSSYMVMNSKHIGADMVYAWPNAQICLMEPEAAINVMYTDELKTDDKDIKILEYRQNQASPYVAARRGYIDDIIEPAQTRKYLIVALEMLESKRETRPAKKHSSISL
jgi:acetyl-CoA carboxylase carboxyltransferase component